MRARPHKVCGKARRVPALVTVPDSCAAASLLQLEARMHAPIVGTPAGSTHARAVPRQQYQGAPGWRLRAARHAKEQGKRRGRLVSKPGREASAAATVFQHLLRPKERSPGLHMHTTAAAGSTAAGADGPCAQPGAPALRHHHSHSRKHWRQMFRPYLRIRPPWLEHTRQRREPLPYSCTGERGTGTAGAVGGGAGRPRRGGTCADVELLQQAQPYIVACSCCFCCCVCGRTLGCWFQTVSNGMVASGVCLQDKRRERSAVGGGSLRGHLCGAPAATTEVFCC